MALRELGSWPLLQVAQRSCTSLATIGTTFMALRLRFEPVNCKRSQSPLPHSGRIPSGAFPRLWCGLIELLDTVAMASPVPKSGHTVDFPTSGRNSCLQDVFQASFASRGRSSLASSCQRQKEYASLGAGAPALHLPLSQQ